MSTDHFKNGIAFIVGLLLIFASIAGCQDNPVDGSEKATLNQATSASAEEGVGKGSTVYFDDAEVYFERNLTDNDLGLQIFLDAEGWTKIDVTDPNNHKIFQVHTQHALSELGITEFRFESAEPSPAEVLGLFPPGEYAFSGKTVEGDRLVGTGELSHDFVPAFTFSPDDGAIVDPNSTTITWNAPGAELVEIIIENEENDKLFDVTMDDETGSLDIPPQFLDVGIEYKLELLAYHENGNRTILERFFTTQ